MSAQVMIERGDTISLRRTRGVAVRVVTGRAWVTQPDDPVDHDLKEGEVIDLNGRAPALLKAWEPTLLDLHHSNATALRRRLEREAAAERAAQMRAAGLWLVRALSAFAQRARHRFPG